MEPEKFNLPASVTGIIEINRLTRELRKLEDDLLQLKIRQAGSQVKLPITTSVLDQVVSHNQLNLLHQQDREKLASYLNEIKQKAPTINISFSADPTPDFKKHIVSWLRSEVHPYILLNVGLQPAIGAGCIVRTTNKIFDFSLRQNFKIKKNLLKKELVVIRKPKIAHPQANPGGISA